ncbi:fungal-specific transcription factor domain-containing protein [Aspergillus pseudoustus]|uniref:Fungal-specific transcription factor domain-containing protein n=1 Tax=Aspergillus pseudoustus TaxID=1810923 RepID=A0ABR4INI0_9EURO
MDRPPPTRNTNERRIKSCKRCHRRKQRCHGFPVCTNCAHANLPCERTDFAISLHGRSSQSVASERIQTLESQLSEALAQLTEARREQSVLLAADAAAGGDGSSSEQQTAGPDARTATQISSWLDQQEEGGLAAGASSPAEAASATATSPRSRQSSMATTAAEAPEIPVLGPGGQGGADFMGAQTGLDDIVHATFLTRALSSAVGEQASFPPPGHQGQQQRQGPTMESPPSDEIGLRVLHAYFDRFHPRYPFLDRGHIFSLHSTRHEPVGADPAQRFATFKLYLVYAIGATLVQLAEQYTGPNPEQFVMHGLRHISAARQSHALHTLEAMVLLILYSLRSPFSSSSWDMVGLAMRKCIELGLHRGAHYYGLDHEEAQRRYLLFWSVYSLDRGISIALSRPFSLMDQDIDTPEPCEIDGFAQDLVRPLHLTQQQQQQPVLPPHSHFWIKFMQITRIHSRIKTEVYRLDEPQGALFRSVPPILAALEQWKASLQPITETELDFLLLQFNTAISLLLRPFLGLLCPGHPHIQQCLTACGQACELLKRLHQRCSYAHSFVSSHFIFISGVTICYCLSLEPSLFSVAVMSHLSACSSTMFLMAERTPHLKKHRDVLDTLINRAVNSVLQNPAENPQAQYAHGQSHGHGQSQSQRQGLAQASPSPWPHDPSSTTASVPFGGYAHEILAAKGLLQLSALDDPSTILPLEAAPRGGDVRVV